MRPLLIALALLCALGEARLINGAAVDKKDWPATVYAAMGNSRCTADVIGERTLVLAAHCVSNGGTATFSAGGKAYQAKCTHAPQYSQAAWNAAAAALIEGAKFDVVPVAEEVAGNATADWALCYTKEPVTGIVYETLNQDPDLHKVGDKITIAGYGCIRKGGGGGNDGILRVGKSTIIDLPNGNDNDIVTRGDAALCSGDSGGPAFHGEGNDRRLISINSRGDLRTTSYLVSVSTDMARKFFKDWADKNSAKICGIHPEAINCRGVATAPNPFPMENDKVACTVTVKPAAPFKPEWLKKTLQSFLDNLPRR